MFSVLSDQNAFGYTWAVFQTRKFVSFLRQWLLFHTEGSCRQIGCGASRPVCGYIRNTFLKTLWYMIYLLSLGSELFVKRCYSAKFIQLSNKEFYHVLSSQSEMLLIQSLYEVFMFNGSAGFWTFLHKPGLYHILSRGWWVRLKPVNPNQQLFKECYILRKKTSQFSGRIQTGHIWFVWSEPEFFSS